MLTTYNIVGRWVSWQRYGCIGIVVKLSETKKEEETKMWSQENVKSTITTLCSKDTQRWSTSAQHQEEHL